jgi:hypothetical protein
MKYAVELGSGAMIYIPSFVKIGSGIHKLIGGNMQTAWRLHNPTFIHSRLENQANKCGELYLYHVPNC